MSYRNGTYIAFHAQGTADPSASDQKYYRLLQAWCSADASSLHMINSHDKAAAVRDTSKRATLRASLAFRLRRSKNMILIISPDTRHDKDWVPFEIRYAIDNCSLPIIVAYTGYSQVRAPFALEHLWPPALADRIASREARTVHVPFAKRLIADAVSRYDVRNPPPSAVMCYPLSSHQKEEVSRRRKLHRLRTMADVLGTSPRSLPLGGLSSLIKPDSAPRESIDLDLLRKFLGG